MYYVKTWETEMHREEGISEVPGGSEDLSECMRWASKIYFSAENPACVEVQDENGEVYLHISKDRTVLFYTLGEAMKHIGDSTNASDGWFSHKDLDLHTSNIIYKYYYKHTLGLDIRTEASRLINDYMDMATWWMDDNSDMISESEEYAKTAKQVLALVEELRNIDVYALDNEKLISLTDKCINAADSDVMDVYTWTYGEHTGTRDDVTVSVKYIKNLVNKLISCT